MKRLVLVGAGHAHAQVILELMQQPLPDTEVVLVSPVAQAPYSGMVPGWLGGHYRWDESCIDFAQLCVRANVRLALASVTALNTATDELTLSTGERLTYHWLSLNIGATLVPPDSEHLQVLPLRPLSALHARWAEVLQQVEQLAPGSDFRVAMIGGGAAGVESILAAHAQLTQLAPTLRFGFTLATQADDVTPGMPKGAAQRLRQHLRTRGIVVKTGFSAARIESDRVIAADSSSIPANAVLWATGAQAYAWPGAGGLSTDVHGFIRINRQLRSVSHPNVFASGDCSAWEQPLPKAGVYAVRMGPILSHNLRAAIAGAVLQSYAPQRRYLVLIGTGDAHAIAVWGALAWQGNWMWRWKQFIDRRFIARYNQSAAM